MVWLSTDYFTSCQTISNVFFYFLEFIYLFPEKGKKLKKDFQNQENLLTMRNIVKL